MFAPATGKPSSLFTVRCQPTVTIGVTCGDEEWTLRAGPATYRLEPGRPDAPDLRLAANSATWKAYANPLPSPGQGTIAGLHRTGAVRVEGDLLVFYRDQLLIEDVFGRLLRSPPREVSGTVDEAAVFEQVRGGYIRIPIAGRIHRLYVEEAGEGTPLLCLHTAGSDSRQYRGVLNDPEITSRFRVIAFDLPRHGKSSPPAGFQHGAYSLTADEYYAAILAVCDGLELDRPVVMGCSIGGRMVLELGLRCPDRFRAGIGLQSAPSAERGEADSFRTLGVARRSDVNGPEAAAGRVRPLMGPESPASDRWETLWHYMQSGPGIFEGDTDYYFDSGNSSEEDVERLAAADFPLFLLAGDYDLGVPPDMSRKFADRIGARRFSSMPGLGHFPMSEDPARFRTYLLPILDEIAELG